MNELVDFEFSSEPKKTHLRGLSAGLATTGKIPMFTTSKLAPEKVTFGEDELIDVYDELSADRKPDLVCVGCPHLSLEEVATLARMLKGKKVRTDFWICVSRKVAEEADLKGYADIIKRAGAHLVTDTCMVVAPLEDLGYTCMLTNSAKAAHYARTMCKIQTELASTEECVNYVT